MIDIDMSEIKALVDDLEAAARKAMPEITEAARTSGEIVRDNARSISAGSRRGAPQSIRSVVSRGSASVTARVEYGSAFGAILEFGTPTSAAYAALGPSLDREAPEFVTAVEDAIDRAFR